MSIVFTQVGNARNLCETSFNKEVAVVSKVMSERKNKSRWNQYAEFLGKFNDCLDASYAETIQGISEDALATDWIEFTSFVEKSNPPKKILINIESGFSAEMGLTTNLKKIKENAKHYCPLNIKEFCDKVLKTK